MVPFWLMDRCGSSSELHQTYQVRQLKFLKWLRDHLQTRLAATNGAIAALEEQIQRDNQTHPQPKDTAA
ncbi:hypothetical protein [Chroococcidiopsis sp. TS-821]|uniref:hypothetical protein n=1 Tax=Chroococcidiopsis sp. TS-821 TaxID=1378066 RepID=UPI000CEDF1C1|nr:hypothetical protein [Chroococcidiopsis sp. TS-821]PPS40425.1 hypothetical protein B1A85_20430 [Chroococcidiopsis sp. TS-821]